MGESFGRINKAPQLWAIRKAIRELRKNRKKGSENYHQKMDRLKSRAAEIEIRINSELFV